MIVGLFTPVNESTWEHMKLVFFPMLLFSLLAIPKLKKAFPGITSSLLSGVLLGTALIPVLFYTYTGILGRNFFILDMAVFVLSVIAAFLTAYRLTLSCTIQSRTLILLIAAGIVLVCFLLFTFIPPNIGIFVPPSV